MANELCFTIAGDPSERRWFPKTCSMLALDTLLRHHEDFYGESYTGNLNRMDATFDDLDQLAQDVLTHSKQLYYAGFHTESEGGRLHDTDTDRYHHPLCVDSTGPTDPPARPDQLRIFLFTSYLIGRATEQTDDDMTVDRHAETMMIYAIDELFFTTHAEFRAWLSLAAKLRIQHKPLAPAESRPDVRVVELTALNDESPKRVGAASASPASQVAAQPAAQPAKATAQPAAPPAAQPAAPPAAHSTDTGRADMSSVLYPAWSYNPHTGTWHVQTLADKYKLALQARFARQEGGDIAVTVADAQRLFETLPKLITNKNNVQGFLNVFNHNFRTALGLNLFSGEAATAMRQVAASIPTESDLGKRTRGTLDMIAAQFNKKQK